MRGSIVGGANLYTTIGLANNTATTIQNVSGYSAGTGGSLKGYIQIDATTDTVITFETQFTKPLTGTGYNATTTFGAGDVPSGLSIDITTGGLIQVTLPSIAGLTAGNAQATFAINAAAVGTSLPLNVSIANVSPNTSGVAPAAGIIGETKSSSASSVETTALAGGGTGATATIATITNLPIGYWLIVAEDIAYWSAVPTTAGKVAALGSDIYDGSSVVSNAKFTHSFGASSVGTADSLYTRLIHCVPFNNTSASTTITFRLRCDKVSGDEANGAKVYSNGFGFLKAIRIG
jgi:hypothetical protein